jgi:chromosomal replication initiation ATPase DnaA
MAKNMSGRTHYLSLWAGRVPLPPCERPSMREIIAETAAKHDMSIRDLKADTRAWRYSHARHEAMFRMKAEGYSHKQIVDSLGLKDHTSSVWGCKAHAARLAG